MDNISIDYSKFPSHVGIIMDGNGRWAIKNNKDRNYGHLKGAETAEKVIEWSKNFGIKYLTLYTFSEENWKRPKEEIEFLFDLLVRYFESNYVKMTQNGVKVRFLGRINKLPPKVSQACLKTEQMTQEANNINLIMAMNYSGRQEIVDAVNKIIKEGKKEITIKDIEKNLYLPDVPYPDLIIRTAGEKRLSNFLLWESAYSEFYFTDVLWPDFTYEEYLLSLLDYSKRERRFGGIPIHNPNDGVTPFE